MKHSNKVDGRPAMQFYVDDWLAEPALRLCDLSARGLWIDMLCCMWKSPERGIIRSKAKQTLKQTVSRMVGVSPIKAEAALKQLIEFGVAESPDEQTLYSRRMVRDEKLRRSKVEAGRKGGRRSKPKAKPEAKGGSPTPTPTPTPSPVPTPPPEEPESEAPFSPNFQPQTKPQNIRNPVQLELAAKLAEVWLANVDPNDDSTVGCQQALCRVLVEHDGPGYDDHALAIERYAKAIKVKVVKLEAMKWWVNGRKWEHYLREGYVEPVNIEDADMAAKVARIKAARGQT